MSTAAPRWTGPPWFPIRAGGSAAVLRDMAKFQFSNSTCQVEGELVPVAEINLSPGDGVIFEHHTMLWKDGSYPSACTLWARPEKVPGRHALCSHPGRADPAGSLFHADQRGRS